MHRFKSAILAIFHFWQIGTFELVHGIQKFFWPKDFFWSVLKMTFKKNISVWVRQIQDLGQSV